MKSDLGQRRTPLWEYKRYVHDSLTSLLDDLVDATDAGVTDEQCTAIHMSLEKGANLAAAIPDGPFSSLRKATEQFAARHRSWNEISGSSAQAIKARQECMKQLRRTRHKIARRVRKNGYVIGENLDLEMLRDMRRVLIELARSAPNSFPALLRTAARLGCS